MKTRIIMLLFFVVTPLCIIKAGINYSGTLKDLFIYLHDKHNYNFIYSNNEVNDQQKINVKNIDDKSIDTIMQLISGKFSLSYVIRNKHILIKKQNKKKENNLLYIETDSIKEKKESETNKQMKYESIFIDDTLIIPKRSYLDIDSKSLKRKDSVFNSQYNHPVKIIADSEEKKKKHVKSKNIYELNLHHNLVYDLVLTPNIGIEGNINKRFGFVLNAYWTHLNWNNKEKTYRIWGVSPEVRYYFTKSKRFYIGGMFQAGELNLKLNEIGNQGTFIGGGIISGYQITLNKKLKLDVGIGLGYNQYKYDSYHYANGKNIRDNSGLKKQIIPLKAGAALVWKLN